jgi:aminoglycoside phosphotransferase (APT) family kinase protein
VPPSPPKIPNGLRHPDRGLPAKLQTMDHYAPLPTDDQLQALSGDLGAPVRFSYRIESGMACTMDVLVMGSAAPERVVLRRYWLRKPGDSDPAGPEVRSLGLAAEHGIPAPRPLWIDRIGLFPEGAILISYVDGSVVLEPDDPIDWAEQLAHVLAAIHRMEIPPDDEPLFPLLIDDDGQFTQNETATAVRQHPLGTKLWSRRAQARASFIHVDPVYLHHDFWPGNVLWTNGSLAAVVDWEGGSRGDPALDVAYCSMDIRHLGLDRAADHFVDTYRRITGRPLSNLEYWNLLALRRPLPDVAVWVPGWNAMGFGVTVEEARSRHTELIEDALRQPWGG